MELTHTLLLQNISYSLEGVRKQTIYNVSVNLVNPKNTTQICSSCGELVPKALVDRIHCCPHCGLEVDRDLNAAINICSVGITQSYAYGDLTSTQGYCVPEQAKSMK